MTAAETVLLRARTHPKVLFKPLLIQLALIVAHFALTVFWPENIGIEYLDEWGQLAVHAFIVGVEFTYAILPLLRWWNHTFTLTTRRVEERWGVLYRNSREIPLDRIVGVSTERGIIDRIFGCGTLVFLDAAYEGTTSIRQNPLSTRGAPANGIRFNDVPRVERVRQLVDEARFS